MMWTQNYNPLEIQALSALVAAIPIIIFLLGLTVLKWTGLKAATASLAAAVVIAVLVFHAPVTVAGGSVLYGVLLGIWPVGWIVIMAVWLYRLTVKAGYFSVIESSISSLAVDQRIQVLLIAFCFGGFLEGAAGFGIPIAICGALLMNLGFKPLRGASVALVANIAFGAYGAIGIPVLVGAKVGGLTVPELTPWLALAVQVITIFIPLVVVMMVDGIRGAKETGVVALLLGVFVSAMQAGVLIFLGPELVDIVPPLAGLGFLIAINRVWKPKRIYREPTALSVEELAAKETVAYTPKDIAVAWSPFAILSVLILLWSVPSIKSTLNHVSIPVHVPFLDGRVLVHAPVTPKEHALHAVWTWNAISAAGTAILLAVIITALTAKTINFAAAVAELKGTLKQLLVPVTMICLVLAVANVMSSSGMSSSMALALAAAGSFFPLLSPLIGWVGVFVTGSVVNANTLFAGLQAVTGQQIGVSTPIMVASNTAGGVMAKAVSPQSVAIATAAVGQAGKEAELTRGVLKFSLGFLAVLGVWVMVIATLWG